MLTGSAHEVVDFHFSPVLRAVVTEFVVNRVVLVRVVAGFVLERDDEPVAVAPVDDGAVRRGRRADEPVPDALDSRKGVDAFLKGLNVLPGKAVFQPEVDSMDEHARWI